MLEDNSEKLTINVSIVDLGKIDYLVQQGFYGNRTDFLRAAIKGELRNHENWLNKEFIAKTMEIGIIRLSTEDLSHESKQDLYVLGLLIIEDSVKLEDLKRHYRKIKVYGKVKCNKEVKEYYGL